MILYCWEVVLTELNLVVDTLGLDRAGLGLLCAVEAIISLVLCGLWCGWRVWLLVVVALSLLFDVWFFYLFQMCSRGFVRTKVVVLIISYWNIFFWNRFLFYFSLGLFSWSIMNHCLYFDLLPIKELYFLVVLLHHMLLLWFILFFFVNLKRLFIIILVMWSLKWFDQLLVNLFTLLGLLGVFEKWFCQQDKSLLYELTNLKDICHH